MVPAGLTYVQEESGTKTKTSVKDVGITTGRHMVAQDKEKRLKHQKKNETLHIIQMTMDFSSETTGTRGQKNMNVNPYLLPPKKLIQDVSSTQTNKLNIERF